MQTYNLKCLHGESVSGCFETVQTSFHGIRIGCLSDLLSVCLSLTLTHYLHHMLPAGSVHVCVCVSYIYTAHTHTCTHTRLIHISICVPNVSDMGRVIIGSDSVEGTSMCEV